MKKLLIFMVVCLAMIACKNGTSNEPELSKQEVMFKVTNFEQTQEPMNTPRRSPILDDENGTALTDLYVFDGTTQLAHQTNDQEDFGTVVLNLTHGDHNLSFILTRSTGLSVEDGIMTMASVRPTFGKLLTLNVASNTPAQNLTLDRLSGQLNITINDEFPAAANQIEFILENRYTQIDVTNLLGVNGDEWSQKVSCTSKIGQTNVEYTFNTICPSLTDEYTSDLTVNVYNAGGSVIYSVTIENVRFASNTKTMLSSNLFTVPSASTTVNTSWNQNIIGTF